MSIDPKTTRGYRNRNPGNIEHVPANAWQGLAEPPSDGRFCRFTSHEFGIRALAALLVTYQDRHKLRTPRAIIERWAPKGACAPAGSEPAYLALVPYSHAMQVQAAEPLAALPVGSVLARMIDDYGDLRARIRGACGR